MQYDNCSAFLCLRREFSLHKFFRGCSLFPKYQTETGAVDVRVYLHETISFLPILNIHSMWIEPFYSIRIYSVVLLFVLSVDFDCG